MAILSEGNEKSNGMDRKSREEKAYVLHDDIGWLQGQQ